ncbi:MAG: Maf family protein, partial [Proteobacteria bacterium]|nr:Maf family protein [Pseudomonadota bacterium]
YIERGVIISADAVVALKKKVIGKPVSLDDAIDILSRLEGKWHSVFTSYCIYLPHLDKKILRTVRTYVKFKPMKRKEIKNYVNSENVLDKAGAYAFQGIGGFMIEKIEGSPTNVIGLPLTEIVSDLLKLKVIGYR